MNKRAWWIGILLLLALWATRLGALDLLPIHNDEGLHLTRAVEVWNGHPFWAISDGKIINHWLIAAFYPQNEPVFAGRIATVFVSLIGLAAGYALVYRFFGGVAAVLAGVLWICCPYLFFYERLAFSDAEAGSLIVLSIWAALRLSFSPRPEGEGLGVRVRPFILVGLTFAVAALFKFTAAPYALTVTLVVLFANRLSWRHRILGLITIAITVALCFAVPLIYLLTRGEDLFSIALGWVGGSSGGQPSFVANLDRLASQLIGYGSITWVILLALGLILLLLTALGLFRSKHIPSDRRTVIAMLLLGGILPLLIILVLGREVLSRHWVVTLPLLLTLGGAGLGIGLKRVRDVTSQQLVAGFGVVALVFGIVPFFITAYSNPAALPLPADARYEHITSHSSGYGLREAMQALPQTLTRRDLPIIGSMFADSCKRANFYAVGDLTLICVGAPGVADIEAALTNQQAVYVLADTAPLIGVDVTALKVKATRIAAYPRPGETQENASVVLWLLENPDAASAATDCATQTAMAAYSPSSTQPFISLRDGHFILGDKPFLARGVNYYPARYPWRRFLTQVDLQTVTEEMALMHSYGFNTLRIFLWNNALFICPSINAIPNPDAFGRLDVVIKSAAAQNFHLIVTLNDMPDFAAVPLYTNTTVAPAQTRFIIDRYKDEPAILAWDLRNEGDIDYGSNDVLGRAAFPREDVLNWLSQTSSLVRSLDTNHLTTAGWLHDSESTAPSVDFISFHHWIGVDEMIKRVADIRANTDKPILLEEFGFSTFRYSLEDQNRLIVSVAHAAQSENLLGWMLWTAFDFPLDATCIPPACPSADNAEHHFGLWYANYTPKPVLEALRTLLQP
ncbi:MAG: cellulase family glycosylhydrolase [Anaerolineaceae bacterium]|nr:cellulase family glycosylhydrolase [Anaerolineaceae bacterium]